MERMEYFSRYFKGCKKVLDVGCGTGPFLEIMQKQGIPALGVDIGEEPVKACVEKGLAAVCADAFVFLTGKDNLYDGVMISNLVEHLEPKQVKDLLEKCFRSLKKDGIILAALPDPKNIKDVLGDFWEDTTHVRMYPVSVLNKMFIAAGFKVEKIVEKKIEYPKLLWKLRDAFRNMLVGPYWGRSEIYVVARKR